MPFTGGCMCGSVRYQILGPIRDVIACHCEQCRRASGHYVAATATQPTDLKIEASDDLGWFEGTSHIRRGFCRKCGSTLFFDHGPDYPTGVAAGTLDDCGEVKISAHIWTDEAGAYYTLPAGEPSYTSSEWRARSGWDPLEWSDGENHLQGARKFNEYE